MDVVINKRKVRDTVRQIVAGGNRTLKQEIRSRFAARMATGNRRFCFSIQNRGRKCLVTVRAFFHHSVSDRDGNGFSGFFGGISAMEDTGCLVTAVWKAGHMAVF